MRHWKIVGSFIAVLVVLLSGCRGGQDEKDGAQNEPTPAGDFPMTVSDCGRDVVLKERPERVLTMGSSAATLMWAAGAADRIAVRAAEGGAPLGKARNELAGIPQISPEDDLSKETIIGQSPDLVISAGLNTTTAEDLETAGIPSIVNAGFCDGTGSGKNPDSDIDFDDVISDVRLYGKIFGTESAARTKIADMRTRIDTVKNTSTADDDMSSAAAVIVDGNKLTAYGKMSMTHTQIETLGLTDVFGDLKPRINDIGSEAFIDRDPDVVIALYSGQGVAAKSAKQVRRDLHRLPGASKVSAIKHDRIIALQAPYLLASPLSVDGLERMAAQIEHAQRTS